MIYNRRPIYVTDRQIFLGHVAIHNIYLDILIFLGHLSGMTGALSQNINISTFLINNHQ